MPDGIIGPTCLIGLISDSSSGCRTVGAISLGTTVGRSFFLTQDRSLYARNLLSSFEFSFSGWSSPEPVAGLKKLEHQLKDFLLQQERWSVSGGKIRIGERVRRAFFGHCFPGRLIGSRW
jgi:hypothetical protein